MNRYDTRVHYGSSTKEVSIEENSLEDIIAEAKLESYKEGEVVYITEVVATVIAEQPEVKAQVEHQVIKTNTILLESK